MRKRILRPDHENKGVPTKTHGAKRGAPSSAHKSKKTLSRPNSAPSNTHLSKKTLKRSDSTPKKSHDRSANLGTYLFPAKKIGSVKNVVRAIKQTKGRTNV